MFERNNDLERKQLAPGVYITTLDAAKFNRCRITLNLRFTARRDSATDADVMALVLARGYALVTDAKGKVCTMEQLQPEQTICVRSRQYQARCRVETVEEINESTQKL